MQSPPKRLHARKELLVLMREQAVLAAVAGQAAFVYRAQVLFLVVEQLIPAPQMAGHRPDMIDDKSPNPIALCVQDHLHLVDLNILSILVDLPHVDFGLVSPAVVVH